MIVKYIATMNSNAAPIVSDTSRRIIDANDAMDALTIMLAEYYHSAGLFSAIIETDEPTPRLIARFASARANAQAFAAKKTTSTVRGEGDRFIIQWCGVETPVFVSGFNDVAEFFDTATGKVVSRFGFKDGNLAPFQHDEHRVTPFPW
jgi:hypothetical protein